MSDAPPPEAPAKKGIKKSTGVVKKKSEAAKSDSGFGSVEKIDQGEAVPVNPPPEHAASVPPETPDRKTSAEGSPAKPPSARTSLAEEAPVSSSPKKKPTTSDDDLPINVNPYEDMISRDELNNYKTACDSIIQDLQDRLSHEEDAAASLGQGKKKLEGDIHNLKKDIENVELQLQKVSLVD